jgi:hypothetical protein
MNAQSLQRIAEAFIKALEEGDLLFLEKYLTPDVVYIHGMALGGTVQGKQEVLWRMEPFMRAFPDWRFNARDFTVDVEQRIVTCTIQVMGTNTGEMDFRVFGQGVYKPTGRSFVLPVEQLMLTIRGASVSRIEVPAVEGAGFLGIFQQIDLER